MIRLLDNQKDRIAYEKLCVKLDASVFNSFAWMSLFKKIKLYGIFNNNEELIGAFYFYNYTKYGLELNICPPFTPHNGLIFENRAENSANINSVNKNILNEVSDFISDLNSKLLVFVLPTGILETQSFTWKNMEVKVKYTYHIDLNLPEDTLLANLSSEKRKSLNKAKADQLEIVRTSEMRIVKEVVLKTFSRKQINKNIHYFDEILFNFANEGNAFAFVAYQGKQAIAASFCVHDAGTAYYLFGGYDAEQKHHGAGVSCMWQSILHAKQLGLRTFDFEGSMIPEVEKYFREFGGTLVPYYHIGKIRFPLNIVYK
jgi:lipid II:glycine glycyltransferase (peptidoglycan interpeptide bridge formation enzyme)